MRLRHARGVGVAAALAVAAAAGAARAETPRWTFQLEAGPELDTNVHREEGAGVAATDLRAAARGGLAWRAPARTTLRLEGLAATRRFGDDQARAEDVLLVGLDGRIDVRATERLVAGLRLGVTDVSERDTVVSGVDLDRDFRTGSALATLTLLGGERDRVTATAGGRFFEYKPNPAFDFAGEQVGLAYTHVFADEVLSGATSTWDLSVAYAANRRLYRGPAFANVCPDGETITARCLVATGARRADLFHAASVELIYVGDLLAAARYELHVNDSNAFAQSLVRHRVALEGTVGVGWKVFLSARVVAQLNRFLDGLLLAGDVGTYITIEDEARNGVILHATRDLAAGVSVEARAAAYADAFSERPVAYRRQTFYLGLIWAAR